MLFLVAVIFFFFCWTDAATLCQKACVVEFRWFGHVMADRGVQHYDRCVRNRRKRKQGKTHLKSQPAEICLTFLRRWECHPVSWSGWITGGHAAERFDCSHQTLLRQKCLYKSRKHLDLIQIITWLHYPFYLQFPPLNFLLTGCLRALKSLEKHWIPFPKKGPQTALISLICSGLSCRRLFQTCSINPPLLERSPAHNGQVNIYL